MLRLYGVPPTRVCRALWLVNALDLACEVIPVDLPAGENRGAAFLAINPFGKVPVLVDGDIALSESIAIMMHLAEAHGAGRLVPTGPAARAQMHQWMYALATEVEQPLWRHALHTGIYPEADRIPAEIANAERDCRRALEPIEAHMTARDWFVGDAVSVVDYNAAFTLDWAEGIGWLEAFPALRRFVARMYARDEAPPTSAEGFACLRAGRIAPTRRRDLDLAIFGAADQARVDA